MVYLVLVSLIWAVSFGLIKATLGGVDADFSSWARLFLGFLIFLPFLRPRALPGRTVLFLVLVGALQYGVMYQLYFRAFSFLAAWEVVLFTIFTPVYVTLLNDLRTKTFHRRFFLAALLAVLAGGWIYWTDQLRGEIWTGFLMMQASNLCFAFGQVAYREVMQQHPKVPDRTVFGWLFAGAVLLSGIGVTVFGDWGAATTLSAQQIGVLFFLGVIATGGGFFGWNVGARKVSAGTLAVMNNLKVPLGIFVALTLFRESAEGGRLLVSFFLIIAALWVSGELHPRREKEKTAEG